VTVNCCGGVYHNQRHTAVAYQVFLESAATVLTLLGLASIGSVLTHLPKFFSWLPPNRQNLLVGETPNPEIYKNKSQRKNY